MPRILKLLTINSVVDTLVEEALGIDVPSGKAIRINSCKVTSAVSVMGSTHLLKEVVVGVAVRDTEQTVMSLAKVVSETDIMGYLGFIDRIGNASNTMGGLHDMNMTENNHGLVPTVFVGQPAVVAASGTQLHLFDVDYDLVKLTTDIAVKIASS